MPNEMGPHACITFKKKISKSETIEDNTTGKRTILLVIILLMMKLMMRH